MKVAIVKYNAGNVQSVLYALKRLNIDAILTDDEDELRQADKVIFPGVGEAKTAMTYLRERGLDQVIPTLTQPVLGICLGMQLMCAYSEENDTPCLGIFGQQVRRFPGNDAAGTSYKVPKMGWNNIFDLKSVLFEGLSEEDYVYFVHGYYVEAGDQTIAKAKYGPTYSAALQLNNFYATQFHPEKSSKIGAKILENFLLKT